ncbi:hypothetical protein ACFL2S_03325 [Thermodesulfobacteriota bacterium]
MHLSRVKSIQFLVATDIDDIAERKPWLTMDNNFENTRHLKRFGGFVFISTGQKM